MVMLHTPCLHPGPSTSNTEIKQQTMPAVTMKPARHAAAHLICFDYACLITPAIEETNRVESSNLNDW